MNSYFSSRLLHWNRLENDRQMPWKGEKDPYRIWLSEVILQQTRVEQGWTYYERFIKAFPTIRQLADAPETRVFKLWEGLGYYSRCRNLLETAKYVANELDGHFPADLNGIRALKGVGPYTAAAIASFAYGLPYAVLDGNVLRVLSRFFGSTIPVDSTEGRRHFADLAQQLIDRDAPALYNQAIMDLGATVCKPRAALCERCPLAERCMAFRQGNVELLPVKGKKAPRKDRYFYYVVVERRGRLLVRERSGPDIWRHLHEFILIEREAPATPAAIWKELRNLGLATGTKPDPALFSRTYRQALTHQNIQAVFITLPAPPQLEIPKGYSWKSVKSLKDLAFPRLIISFLSEKWVNWVDS
jgi:A/G-specific adenine glycosylase